MAVSEGSETVSRGRSRVSQKPGQSIPVSDITSEKLLRMAKGSHNAYRLLR